MHFQIKRAHWVPDAMNENRQPISRQIIMIQNTENKEISPKERRIRSEIRMAWTVSTEAPKVRRPFSNGFKSLQENYPQLKILYPTKLSIKFEIKKKKDISCDWNAVKWSEKNCFHVLKRLLEDMFHQNKFVRQEKDSRKQESNSKMLVKKDR